MPFFPFGKTDQETRKDAEREKFLFSPYAKTGVTEQKEPIRGQNVSTNRNKKEEILRERERERMKE